MKLLETNPFWVTFYCLAIASLFPIWSIALPPYVDLAQHAAQASALLRLSEYQNLYELNWQTPYYGFLILSSLLSLPYGVLVGIKVSLSLIILATPLSLLIYLKETHSNRWLSLLGFPLSYGFAFYWGFATYTLSIPCCIAFLTTVLISLRNPSLKTSLLVCATSLALFFTHPITYATGVLIAGALCLENRLNKKEKNAWCWVKSAIPFAPSLTLTALWLHYKPKEGNFPTIWSPNLEACLHDGASGAGGTAVAILLDLESRIANLFNWALSGSPSVENHADLILPGWIALALGLCALSFTNLKHPPPVRNLIPSAIALLIFLLSPEEHAGIDNLARRQPILVLCLATSLFTAPLPKNTLLKKLQITTLVLTCLAALYPPAKLSMQYKNEAKDILALIEKTPPNKTLVKLQSTEEGWPTLHMGAWYQALKGGQTLKEFTWLHHMPIRRKEGRTGRMDLVEWFQSPIDYYLYRNPIGSIQNHNIKNIENHLQRKLRLENIAQMGEWRLAREIPQKNKFIKHQNPVTPLLKKKLDDLRNRRNTLQTPDEKNAHNKKNPHETKK